MAKIIYSILLILTLITIFLFSSQNGSQSLGLTMKGINKVTNANIEKKEEARPGVPKKEEEKTFVDRVIVFVRKSAHFIEYMILGVILMLLLNSFHINMKYAIMVSISFCFLYACTDEIHQLFVVGRTGRFTDVLIDTCGSFTGIMLSYIIGRIGRGRKDGRKKEK